MNDFFAQSVFFGIILCLGAYLIGAWIHQKIPSVLTNPLLIGTFIICAFLLLFKIDIEVFNNGGDYIKIFLTPVTVCLAIPLYRQFQILKEHFGAILISIFLGCVACAFTIWGLSVLLQVDSVIYQSLLTKSVTTAIAIGVTGELGGVQGITILGVMISGIFGAVGVSSVCKVARIKDPIAIGLGCGSASHAIGTTRAMEIGEIQGAMSSLAIVVAGLMTVVIAPIMNYIGIV